MRWILLDEVIVIEKGIRAVVRSKVPSEEFSAEVLVTEMMAQTGGLLLGAESEYQSNVVFAKVENALFPARLTPEQGLIIEATSENLRPEGAWMDVVVKEDSADEEGQTLASARCLLMNAGDLVPGREQSITFHQNFLEHFKVKEKIKVPS